MRGSVRMTSGLQGDGKPSAAIGPWAINQVHQRECLAALRDVPSESFDVTITSPPYWGQRGDSGLGSEKDPREYVKNLVTVLHEVMRCLKPAGTLWLNIGDAYNTPINWRSIDSNYSTLGKDRAGHAPDNAIYQKDRGRRRPFLDRNVNWLSYGNLLGIPYRVVLALMDRGWYFRGEIIWEKSRPVPEGRCRRPHRRHEPIYVIAKSERHRFRRTPPVGSIWKLVQQPNLTGHTSAFPVDLPLQCIKAADVAGRGVIFDPFMGSGTTAVAAKILGHDWLGFEFSEKHCVAANARLCDTAEQPSLLGTDALSSGSRIVVSQQG